MPRHVSFGPSLCQQLCLPSACYVVASRLLLLCCSKLGHHARYDLGPAHGAGGAALLSHYVCCASAAGALHQQSVSVVQSVYVASLAPRKGSAGYGRLTSCTVTRTEAKYAISCPDFSRHMKLNGCSSMPLPMVRLVQGHWSESHPESLLYQWSKAIFLQNGGVREALFPHHVTAAQEDDLLGPVPAHHAQLLFVLISAALLRPKRAHSRCLHTNSNILRCPREASRVQSHREAT